MVPRITLGMDLGELEKKNTFELAETSCYSINLITTKCSIKTQNLEGLGCRTDWV